MYPAESCNAGLHGHLRAYIYTCTRAYTDIHVEMVEEYFITIRQIMLNVWPGSLPCARAHGGVRYYMNTYRMPTMRETNYRPLDMAMGRSTFALCTGCPEKSITQSLLKDSSFF